MKQIILAAILGFSTFSATALGSEDVTIDGNVSLTNNYMWRGITQSDKDPAIQGGVDVGYKGFDLGLWGSNVDFNDDDQASMEIDVYGGWTWKLSEDAGIRFGGIYYAYPSANSNLDYNFYEFNVGGYHQFSFAGRPKINIGTSYSPEFFGNSGSAWYHEGGLEVTLYKGLHANGHIGYSDFDKKNLDDYWDYKVGLGYNFDNGVVLSGGYVSTIDLDNSHSRDGNEDQWVGQVSYSF